MAAVAGGLGAALIWSVGIVYASRAARALGPMATLAWVMLIGLGAVAIVLPWSGSAHLSLKAVAWLGLGGAGNVVGLLALYRALRVGQMGVVMPVVSTEGGIAAVIAILAGHSVSVLRTVALAITVSGVLMTSTAPRPPSGPSDSPPEPSAGDPATAGTLVEPAPPRGHTDRRAAAWAGLAALSMGISLFGTGRAGSVLPTAWAVLPPRVVGVAAITIPLAVRGRLRWAPGSGRLLIVAGLCEVGGFFAYAIGARHGLAVAAVLASLTGVFGVGFGRLLFGERLVRVQLAGAAWTFVGVALLSALSV